MSMSRCALPSNDREREYVGKDRRLCVLCGVVEAIRKPQREKFKVFGMVVVGIVL